MNKNSFLSQIARTFSTRMIGMLFAIPTSVFLARGLTPDLRGGFTLVFTSVAVASLFTGMGIAPANAKFSGSDPELRGTLFGNSVFYSLIIGFILFLTLLPTHQIFSLSITNSLIVSILVSLTLFSGFTANILIGSLCVDEFNKAQFIEFSTRLIGYAVCYFTSSGLWSFIIANTLSIGLKMFYIGIVLNSVIAVKPPSIMILTKQIKFGFPLHMSTLLRRVNTSISIYAIRLFLGDADVAYFSIPLNYFTRTKILPQTIAALLLPRAASRESIRFRDQTTLLLRASLNFAFIGSFLIAAIIPYLISFLYGSTYSSSIPIAQILIFSFPFYSFSQISSNYLIGRGMTKFFLRMSTFSFIAGLAVLLITLPLLHLKGAALAILVSEIVSFLYCVRVMNRKEQRKIIDLLLVKPTDLIFIYNRIKTSLKSS